MEIKSLIYCSVIIYCISSCNTTEPEFNPDKVFVEVKNGTVDSDGEFEIFNYYSKSIFINYFQFPYCSFFTYSVEKMTDSGHINLIFDEKTGKWTETYKPDTIVVICEVFMNPVEVKFLHSFKQKVTGIDQVGEYRLTIIYTLGRVPDYRFYSLKVIYKVTH